jgi:hypothetical protein
MSDIVERLRIAADLPHIPYDAALQYEAAAEIERLRAALEKAHLAAALLRGMIELMERDAE